MRKWQVKLEITGTISSSFFYWFLVLTMSGVFGKQVGVNDTYLLSSALRLILMRICFLREARAVADSMVRHQLPTVKGRVLQCGTVAFLGDVTAAKISRVVRSCKGHWLVMFLSFLVLYEQI